MKRIIVVIAIFFLFLLALIVVAMFTGIGNNIPMLNNLVSQIADTISKWIPGSLMPKPPSPPPSTIQTTVPNMTDSRETFESELENDEGMFQNETIFEEEKREFSIRDIPLEYLSQRRSPFDFPQSGFVENEQQDTRFVLSGVIHNAKRPEDSLAIVKVTTTVSKTSSDETEGKIGSSETTENYVTVRLGDWLAEYLVTEIHSNKIVLVQMEEGEIIDKIEVIIE